MAAFECSSPAYLSHLEMIIFSSCEHTRHTKTSLLRKETISEMIQKNNGNFESVKLVLHITLDLNKPERYKSPGLNYWDS